MKAKHRNALQQLEDFNGFYSISHLFNNFIK